MNSKIILCSANDVDTIMQIGKETYIETFQRDNTEEIMSEYISKAFSEVKIINEFNNKNSEFYFIKNNEEVFGYTKLNVNDAQTEFQTDYTLEVERIYIKRKYKGNKLGYKLIQHAIKRAKELGKKEIWLGVWEKNINAIEFYKKCGFYIDGEHPFYMGNDKQNDYIMRRKVEET
jgi:ribosomal protein S18 acetylase RimI-like enzyme